MPLRLEDHPNDGETLKAMLLAANADAHWISSQHQLLSTQNQQLTAEHHRLTEKNATLEREVARLTARDHCRARDQSLPMLRRRPARDR